MNANENQDSKTSKLKGASIALAPVFQSIDYDIIEMPSDESRQSRIT